MVPSTRLARLLAPNLMMPDSPSLVPVQICKLSWVNSRFVESTLVEDDAALDRHRLEVVSQPAVDGNLSLLKLCHDPSEVWSLAENHAIHSSVIPFNHGA